MSAHYLENHYSIMRFGRRVQSIKRFRCNVECGNKSKSKLGASEVVVDCFRNTTDRNSPLIKFCCNAEGAFTPENNQRINTDNFHIRDGFLIHTLDAHRNAIFSSLNKVSAITSSENGPSSGE